MKIPLLTLFIFILSPLTQVLATDTRHGPAARINELRSQNYKIKHVTDDISIEQLAQELKEENTSFYYMELSDFIVALKKWNKHVRSFQNLNGEYIYTDSPQDPYLSYEYIPKLPLNSNYAKRALASVATLKKEINLDYTELSQAKYTFFAHVTASQGQLNEQVSSSGLKNQQNSPLTFGIGSHIRLTPGFAIATSVYTSKLNVPKVDDPQINQTEIKVKNEIGANLYGEYKIPGTTYSVYGGVDYERFTTFNLEDFITGATDQIKTQREKMTFATIGVSFFTQFFLPSSIKLSGSPIIQSNNSFSGYKYMLYVNQKLTKHTWYHLFFKHHQLKNNSNKTIAINRYGAGVGITF